MEEFQAEIKKLRDELQQEKDLREKEKSDSGIKNKIITNFWLKHF